MAENEKTLGAIFDDAYAKSNRAGNVREQAVEEAAQAVAAEAIRRYFRDLLPGDEGLYDAFKNAWFAYKGNSSICRDSNGIAAVLEVLKHRGWQTPDELENLKAENKRVKHQFEEQVRDKHRILESYKKEVERLKTENKSLKSDNAELTTRPLGDDVMGSLLSNCKLGLEKARHENADMKEENARLKAENRRLNKDATEWEQEVRDLKQQLKTATDYKGYDANHWGPACEMARREVERLKAENENLMDEIADGTSFAYNMIPDRSREPAETLDEQLHEVKKHIESLKAASEQISHDGLMESSEVAAKLVRLMDFLARLRKCGWIDGVQSSEKDSEIDRMTKHIADLKAENERLRQTMRNAAHKLLRGVGDKPKGE
ncbi:MAG: hypothetical protein WC378_00295 [Opitutaceae bacterium]|jgi:cell division protein FtsB